MACRVALPRAYTGGERGSSREGGGWSERERGAREREAEDLGLGVAGMRIGGSPGGSHHFSYSAPTSARKQSSSGGSRGGSRGSDGVRLAFGSRVGPASTPPSRNRSRPTSQPDSAWARSSSTQGEHHSRSRDGTPGGSGTRNERFNEDLASYFAAQGHGRSSGFIDKLSRRNSMDRDLTSGGADGKGGGLPYVDARPKPPPGYASPARGDRLAGSQADWGDDMAALGDLGASPRSPGAAIARWVSSFGDVRREPQDAGAHGTEGARNCPAARAHRRGFGWVQSAHVTRGGVPVEVKS
jgi:hypothetical protein